MKIDIVTGSRAEYGIMKNLIKKMITSSEVESRVIVTGMHLEKKYGLTKNDIIDDGIEIFKEIPSNMAETSENGITESITSTMTNFSSYFSNYKTDAILILGDRYEIYAVAIVASLMRIPIIHLHGGEVTEGNYDEFIRHGITKMSSLHFTASEIFKKRVIQLGENPSAVFNVGALGVENIKKTYFKSVTEINKKYNLSLEEEKYFVVAFHPETLSDSNDQNSELLNSLESYIKEYKVIFIGSNADTKSDEIMNATNIFIENHSEQCYLLTSVPSVYYYSLIKKSVGFIGNSSSGLIEVPSLGKFSINIGNRQKGRLQGNSIINVENNKLEISNAIEKLININDIEIVNPYEKKETCQQIYNLIIENQDKLKNNVKPFFDLL